MAIMTGVTVTPIAVIIVIAVIAVVCHKPPDAQKSSGKRAGNALRTLGGALGRRGVMTISSLESCILCVISNM